MKKIINVIIALLLLSTMVMGTSDRTYHSGQWVPYNYCNYDGDCNRENNEICIYSETDSVITTKFSFVITNIDNANNKGYWGQCGILSYTVDDIDDTFYVYKSYDLPRGGYEVEETVETVCPVCVPEVINNTIYRNVSVNNTIYKDVYSYSPSLKAMILSSSGALAFGLMFMLFIYLMFIKGFKNRFLKCPKCHNFSLWKIPLQNKFYCTNNDCIIRHNKIIKKPVKSKASDDIKKEASDDIRNKYIPREYRQ